MAKEETLKLLNTDRRMPVTLNSFDGDSLDLPANQVEAIDVPAKFGWNLPRSVKDMTPKKVEKTEETTMQTSNKPVNVRPEAKATPLKS